MGSYETIIEKLDAFVRKYYTNKLIKASIGFFTILFLLILAGNTLEFIFYLDPTYKKIILFLSSASLLYLFVFKILYFGLKIKRLGKVISREEAAILIGKHFPEVSDKLTNTIELQKQLDLVSNKALLLASISQKTESLSLVPFQKAIDFSQNKKYLKFLLPPLAIFIVLIFAAPGFIINSSSRILDYNTAYEKPAPFQFIIENNELLVNESESITLKIKIEGDVIPQDLYLIQKESKFKMEKLSSQKFQYTLENMQQTSSVQVEAAGFKSKPIVIKVIPKPQITNFEVFIDYPAYLGKKDELLENIGDLLVPEGSVLTWNLETENVGMMNFFMEKKLVSTEVKSNKAQFKKQALQSYKYQLFPTHPLNLPTDTLNYQVQIIADQYPKILVEQEIDSITAKSIFFSIKCEDDYGLTRLFLKYKKPSDAKYQSVPIALKAGQNSQQQFYKWDLSFIKTDESIEYFL